LSKPHAVSYCLEERDPALDRKMAEVLLVYRQVGQPNADAHQSAAPNVTRSCDEKAGI
jgi:hypothetical protein